MVTVLTKEEVTKLLDMATVIDSVEEAFRKQTEATVPDRIQIKQTEPNGEVFVMPGVFDPIGTLGLKTVTIYPGNNERGIPRSLGVILLHDNDTGALSAIMDGTHITNYRTGAIGAVAARHLAPAGVSTVGIIGASTQGRHQALALDTELDVETIQIYSRSEMKYEAARALQEQVSADVVAVESAANACEDAGVVVAATASPTPVFPADAAREDALVVGVGSNDPSMREIPGGIMEHADQVYVDDYERCLSVGDIADAIDEGQLMSDDVVSFGSLFDSDPPYRTPDETTVVKSVGSIIFDVQVGSYVLERAEKQEIGRTIDLQGLE